MGNHHRSPEMLRSLKLEMFWDDADKPAVSVPFGDFFGMGLGKTSSYHTVFFANPEGKSFQCFIPMPFKKAARIQITNESGKRLSHIFFDINFEKITTWNNNYLYSIVAGTGIPLPPLPKILNCCQLLIKSKGRFLGVNIGINTYPVY